MRSIFDKIIGLKRLKAIHLNDSMTPFASKKDRHEQIGKGTIGLSALTNSTQHPLLSNVPFVLATPNDISGYEKEIRMLKS